MTHTHGPACAHSHSHSHEHNHGHSHAPAHFGRAFAWGVALNTAFIVLEIAAGLAVGSMALLADAGHNVGDVLGLLLAWGGLHLGTRKPGGRFTYGLGQASILAALANAMVLLVAVGGIGVEAIQRLLTPQPVAGTTVMAVAALGILVNGGTALLFMRGQAHDLNIRGAYLHMMADAGVSLGVVLAGGLVLATGWLWVDAVVGLAIAALILASTWGLLKGSVKLAMAAAPDHVDMGALRTFLTGQPGVEGVHDLHIWPLSTTQTALTCHMVMPKGAPEDFLYHLAEELDEHFDIHHATFQVEKTRHEACADCGV